MKQRDRSPPRNKPWKKLKSMVHWSPFVVSFNKRYPWVQLAGHAGNFKAGDYGRILKKLCPREQQCLERLMRDSLRPHVPTYFGLAQRDGECYNQMEDLLAGFEMPCIMDCKMGVRTYLEEELEQARQQPRLRRDKHVRRWWRSDPGAPNRRGAPLSALAQARYNAIGGRRLAPSADAIGFRIRSIKLKTLSLISSTPSPLPPQTNYLERLKELRAALEQSEFFNTHEVVGSSLLFVHDRTGLAKVWMIDFGKTVPLAGEQTLTHRLPWVEGNREEGYLWGLDNLITIFSTMEQD
nr:inositol-trisphosphate 3-kinase C-like [Chelonoidis abingdonii]